MRLPALVLATSLACLASLFAADIPAVNADPYSPQPYIRVQTPEWVKNATIYQINTRQFTAEGTLRAAAKELPRIRALNIDIVWLMPIHPIGEKNRKGILGSPYSVRDYLAVNPELGTFADLKAFVDEAHQLGMRVILDWVPNHTAWDNPLVTEHPDWYQKDWKGDFMPTPWFDWSDIINLDYRNPGLRKYMTEALKFWVREAGIDGYRCDVAGFVPLDFWNNARRELDAIKPVFMLAEWESRDLHAEAFDMTYAWSWYDALHKVAHGKADVGALFGYYSWNEGFWPHGAIRMTFLSNHDKNSWEGTMNEAFADALYPSIVLSCTSEGMPLLFGSQEAGETKRLKFFERDPIEWKPSPVGDFYRTLFALKKKNTALWNGKWGARMVHVPNDRPAQVLSFVRRNEKDKVFVVLNFSAQPQTVRFSEALCQDDYTDYLSGERIQISDTTELSLPAWGYRVLVRP